MFVQTVNLLQPNNLTDWSRTNQRRNGCITLAVLVVSSLSCPSIKMYVYPGWVQKTRLSQIFFFVFLLMHAVVMDGVSQKRGLLDRFDAIGQEMCEPDADFDALLEEQASVQVNPLLSVFA